MRRLTNRRGRQRERGAVSVVVALLMVVLLGAAAIGVDISAAFAERQELQNGADAGALSIAQSCADGGCGDSSATAQAFAASNKKDGDAIGVVVDLDTDAGMVTVETSTLRQNWFAGILGYDESAIGTRATAIYGPVTGGRTLPVVFSVCEWIRQLGLDDLPADEDDWPDFDAAVEGTIFLSKTSPAEGCDLPTSGNYVPGGFGFIDTESNSSCESVTYPREDGEWVATSPGNTPPSGCDAEDFKALVDSQAEFLIPLFDAFEGVGENAEYRLYAYAGFTMDGFNFGGQYKYGSPVPCGGNERCIAGKFVEVVTLTDANTCWPNCDGSQDSSFGAYIVRLIA